MFESNKSEIRAIITIWKTILILLLSFSSSLHAQEEVCYTNKYLRASNMIYSIANLSANPCTNLYNYACGNFLKVMPRIPSYKVWTAKDWSRHKYLMRLSKEFWIQVNSTTSSVSKMNKYYFACTVPYPRNITYLTEVIQELGGWPMSSQHSDLIHHPLRIEYNDTWSLAEMIKNAALHQVFPFFQLSRSVDYVSDFIEIRRPELTFKQHRQNVYDSSAYKLGYLEAVSDSLHIIYAGVGNVSAQIEGMVADMYSLESELSKIMWVHHWPESVDWSIETAQRSIGNSINLNLKGLLDEYYNHETNQEDFIHVKDQVYMSSFENILKNFSGPTIQNYIVWTAIRTFTSDITTQFVSAPSIIDRQERSNGKLNFQVDSPLWELCIKETIEKFHDVAVIPVEYTMNENIMVNEMFDELKRVLKMSTLNFYDDLGKIELDKKIDACQLRIHPIGYPTSRDHTQKLNSIYEELKVGYNYLENVINYSIYKRKFDEREDGGDRKGRWKYNESRNMFQGEIDAFYSARHNEVVLSYGMFDPPHIHSDASLAVHYGTIGTVLARELSKTFLKEGSEFDKDGNVNRWWSEPTNSSYARLESCFKESLLMNVVNNSFDHRSILKEGLGEIAGLKLAYNGYLATLDPGIMPTQSRSELSGFNITRTQTFALSFAQRFCFSWDNHNPIYSHLNKLLVARPMLDWLFNSNGFWSMFGCPGPLGSGLEGSTCELLGNADK